MAQVIEKANVLTQQRKHPTTLTFDLKRPAATIEVNQWIRSFSKWIKVLEQWKKEAQLIDRLINMSVIGEDTTNSKLVKLQSSLKSLVHLELKKMEVEVLDMQRNVEILRRCVINSGERVNQTKIRMQYLSEKYGSLKHEILHELANAYPIRFQ